MTMPLWLIDVLNRALNSLRAEETVQMAIAARMAHLKQKDFERGIQRLENQARPIGDGAVAAVVPANDKARAWFEANGIRMVEA